MKSPNKIKILSTLKPDLLSLGDDGSMFMGLRSYAYLMGASGKVVTKLIKLRQLSPGCAYSAPVESAVLTAALLELINMGLESVGFLRVTNYADLYGTYDINDGHGPLYHTLRANMQAPHNLVVIGLANPGNVNPEDFIDWGHQHLNLEYYESAYYVEPELEKFKKIKIEWI